MYSPLWLILFYNPMPWTLTHLTSDGSRKKFRATKKSVQHLLLRVFLISNIFQEIVYKKKGLYRKKSDVYFTFNDEKGVCFLCYCMWLCSHLILSAVE